MLFNLKCFPGSLIVVLLLLGVTIVPLASSITPAEATVPDWSTMGSGTSQYLIDIWGSSSSDVFAVGGGGTILHYNGFSWSTMTSGTNNYLVAVWGSSSSDVFAGGDGPTILHFNGSSWSPMSGSGFTGNIRGIWGSSGSDVFAVCINGAIFHYNGTSWSNAYLEPSGNGFNAVWGSTSRDGSGKANDVFAAGRDNVMHYDGSSWNAMSPGMNFTGIWGSSGNDVYFVGDTIPTGSILHYTGSWSSIVSGLSSWIWGIWGSSAGDIYAVAKSGQILHYNGTSWSAMSSGTTKDLYRVWGACAADVFAVGKDGTILHYGIGCPPTITAVNPASGIQGLCPLTVVITGTNFIGATDVSFGTGITVSGLTVYSATLITATVYIDANASLGAHNVSVTTPGGTATLTGGFTVNIAAPVAPPSPPPPANQLIGTGGQTSHGSSFSGTTTTTQPIGLPNIVIQSASLSAKTVTPGIPITVTAVIANKSSVNGNKKVTLYVNGQVETTQGVTVNSGGSSKLTFNVSRSEPGDYTVYVDGVPAGSFQVEMVTMPDSILIFSAVLVALAFLVGTIMLWRRQRTV